ncbi:Hypothetical predicted protein [Paramuricea clavata]|uniref:Uncharacterized protein n=1 Tax=Paramuricea clavata TaxID=317549 RepID=A0A7D9DVW4_PARCT|nr:Hypothetical predicted protein [Paramuricea clavata]
MKTTVNAGQGGKQNRSRKIRGKYNSKQFNNAIGIERKCKYCGPNYSQMLQRTKTLLPVTAKLLAPRVVETHYQEIVKGQECQAKYYNRGTKNLPRLRKEDKVRIQDHRQGLKKSLSVKAIVKAEVDIRSYEVETQDG